MYVKKYYSPKNPLFTLLMAMTGQGEELLNDEKSIEVIASNWKIHIAFLIKNLD